MAKGKIEFFAEGKADALAGKQRKAICAATWQAASYDAGYNEGVAEAQADIAMAEDKPAEYFDKRSCEPVNDHAAHAVSSHVAFLLRESGKIRDTDPGRSTRLWVKARKLIARHDLKAA